MPDTPRTSEDAARETDLLPCPFCGQQPTAQHRRSGWRVACDNDGCPTMPNGFTYEEREGAAEAWNAPLKAALASAEERGAARERELCIADIEGERLTDETGEKVDEAYNMALGHAVAAIHARASKEQKG